MQSAYKCVRHFFHDTLGLHTHVTCCSPKMVETKSVVTAAATPGHPLHHVDTPFERITFGMGCFWGCDCLFGGTKGVLRTRVGYAAGTTATPTYKNIGDHTEVIELEYDPKVIELGRLLELFWNNHEYGLTTPIKRQYCSLILYHTEEQRALAAQSVVEEQKKRPTEKIITELVAAGPFYAAEDYHQKYRLQSHKEFAKAFNLTGELLQTSHVAARLNGYLVGIGGEEQFAEEADGLGLTEDQKAYVLKHLRENKGGSLYC